MAIAKRKTGKYSVTWKDISKGTRLLVHSKEWFDENCEKDIDDDYLVYITTCDGTKTSVWFTRSMVKRCDSVVTVTSIENGYIQINGMDGESDWCWYPEMFECVIS